ncbi:hypothetical protein [Streptomyces sp. NPDC001970]
MDISGTVESPYLYDIKAIWHQQIPQDVTYIVSDRNTAQVKAASQSPPERPTSAWT